VTLPPGVAQARALGHAVEWDPPANILSRVARWTCPCGAAVLDSGTVIYGDAVEKTCPLAAVNPGEVRTDG